MTPFEKELDEIERQIWDAATLNKDNPLGHHLLDAHFEAIKQAVSTHIIGEDESFDPTRSPRNTDTEGHGGAEKDVIADELYLVRRATRNVHRYGQRQALGEKA